MKHVPTPQGEPLALDVLTSLAAEFAAQTVLPPAPDHLSEHVQFGREYHNPAGRAARNGHYALAKLIRLRQEAADEIERLLAFLDDTDGEVDLEEHCEDEGAQCDDEGEPDSGIADLDGLKEQVGGFFGRVL